MNVAVVFDLLDDDDDKKNETKSHHADYRLK